MESETQENISQRLQVAEVQLERSKVIMDSLAGFCHALGQPATVLLSSIELMKLESTPPEMRDQILDMCYDAVLEIRSLLTQMKARREYASEKYLHGNESAGDMLSLQEWSEKQPPKISWD